MKRIVGRAFASLEPDASGVCVSCWSLEAVAPSSMCDICLRCILELAVGVGPSCALAARFRVIPTWLLLLSSGDADSVETETLLLPCDVGNQPHSLFCIVDSGVVAGSERFLPTGSVSGGELFSFREELLECKWLCV